MLTPLILPNTQRIGNPKNEQGLCKLSAYKELLRKTPRQFTYKENKSNYALESVLPYITEVQLIFFQTDDDV